MVSSKEINDYFIGKLNSKPPYIFNFGDEIDWEKIKANFEAVLELYKNIEN